MKLQRLAIVNVFGPVNGANNFALVAQLANNSSRCVHTRLQHLAILCIALAAYMVSSTLQHLKRLQFKSVLTFY